MSPKTRTTPKNWPVSVQFLTSSIYSKHVTSSHISHLQQQPSAHTTPIIAAPPPSQSPVILIAPIRNSSHPAHNQHGLFAARHLPPDAFILFYHGFVHTSAAADTDPASSYDLSLSREHGLAVDATRMGCEARFINDYRGVRADGPNAEFRDVWAPLPGAAGLVEKRVGVFVLGAGKTKKRAKGIARGEEIVVSYGKGFWDGRRGGPA